MTDLSSKRPVETRVSRSFSEDLLAIQPSSRVGSAAAPFPLLAFLGAIWKSTEHFTCIQWLNSRSGLGSEKEQEDLDLGAQERIDLKQ